MRLQIRSKDTNLPPGTERSDRSSNLSYGGSIIPLTNRVRFCESIHSTLTITESSLFVSFYHFYYLSFPGVVRSALLADAFRRKDQERAKVLTFSCVCAFADIGKMNEGLSIGDEDC